MVGTHWLRGNASEWTPRFAGFIDTETIPQAEGDREINSLRLWVASVVDRGRRPADTPQVNASEGFTRRSLAEWIDHQMVGKPNLWLFAHNLGFDLTVSRLPDELHRLGWTMGDFRFAGRNVSGYLTRRGKTIWLVDSTSWWPQKLAELGRLVGVDKAQMPAWEAPEEAWLDYCQQDLRVLQAAVLELLAWWDKGRLGHFTKTGPGCGWNVLRHMSPARMFLVNTEPAGVAADRAGVTGGRRDVTRVGEIDGGPFALLDFSNAHLTVAANCLLPKARLGWHDSYRPDDIRVGGNFFGVLADCELITDTPRYPVRTGRGVFYPVGRFRAWLTSPEIEWAKEAGHLISIGGGYTHDLGRPLQRFGKWALGELDPATSSSPPAVRAVVKQWGRSIPGKFAGRKSTRYDRGPALWPGWHLEPGTSGPDHLPAVDVHIAGRHWWVVQDQDGDNAYPAVLAWVQAYVRVALGKMLEELGEELWILSDTDSAIVDLGRARRWLRERGVTSHRTRNPWKVAEAVCEAVRPVCWPLVPRVKGMSETLTVAGPQHYAADTFSKSSGRPGSAELDTEGRLRWWTWPGVEWQMRHGSPDGFVRVEAAWTEPLVTAHRWVLADGTASPVAVELGEGCSWDVCAWPVRIGAGHDPGLSDHQAPALRGLW